LQAVATPCHWKPTCPSPGDDFKYSMVSSSGLLRRAYARPRHEVAFVSDDGHGPDEARSLLPSHVARGTRSVEEELPPGRGAANALKFEVSHAGR